MKRLLLATILILAALVLLIVACLPTPEPDRPFGGVGVLDAPTPLSGDVIFIGSAPTPAAVYFSTDGGSTFDLLWNAPGRVNALDVFNGSLYAAVDNEIWRTAANVSFTQVYTVTGATNVYTLEVCDDMLWAGADDGKIYSTSDGTTWAEFYDTGEDAVYDIEIWNGADKFYDFGWVGAIATGNNGRMFVVQDCVITGSDDTGNATLVSAAASDLLVPGGDTPGGSDLWSVYAGGTEFAHVIHSFNQFTATNWLTASVSSGVVLEQFMRIAYRYTATPDPSGDGAIIMDYGPYGLKNGDVEYYRVVRGVVPNGGTPTPTPAYSNPTVITTGYNRVNELLLFENGFPVYYMVAGGSGGGGFYVDWSRTFTDTGEFLSVIVAEAGSLGTATPGGTATPTVDATPTRTPTPNWTATPTPTGSGATPTPVLRCDTYTANNLPVAVSSSGDNKALFSVPDVGLWISMALTMTMSHDNLSATGAVLASQRTDGPLWSFGDLAGTTMTTAVFRDTAANLISEGSAPYTGQWRPLLPFTSRFTNAQVYGTWTLYIDSPWPGLTGSVTAAELEICFFDRGDDGTPTPTPTVSGTPPPGWIPPGGQKIITEVLSSQGATPTPRPTRTPTLTAPP